jgi:hypothetical protein
MAAATPDDRRGGFEPPFRTRTVIGAGAAFAALCAAVAICARAYTSTVPSWRVRAPVSLGDVLPIVFVLGVGTIVLLLWTSLPLHRRRRSDEDELVREEPPIPLSAKLAALAVAAALIAAVVGAIVLLHGRSGGQQRVQRPTGVSGRTLPRSGGPGSHAHTNPHLAADWLAIAAAGGVLVFAAAAAATFGAARCRGPAPGKPRLADNVAAAVDASIDDLERDPDARRAVIRAYARMEMVLAAHDLPRRPQEAPLEFLRRALERLTISARSIEALTHLFEQAKFSLHEVDAPMKANAIAALVAVRDEVRRG